MDCLLETETMAVGQGKIPLGEMNGMVLILESGGFFGTEWDDQPIRAGGLPGDAGGTEGAEI